MIGEAEATLPRTLGGIPAGYRVLFLQGGASLQFSMVPMNLLPAGRTADYLVTGVWSQKALKEAKRSATVHVAATRRRPVHADPADSRRSVLGASPAYVHITTNNTIYGTPVAAASRPPRRRAALCDTSCDFFSRPIDVAEVTG